jgi:uncharacterized repeat protein (TIGR03803 family)
MQINRFPPSLIAGLCLLLVGLVVQAPVLASNQGANFIRVNTETAANRPSAVRGDLLLANDGNIYFASSTGGNGRGFVGKLAPDGTISTLYAFATTGDESAQMFAGVIQANDGNLYGTSYTGGAHGAGTLFRLTLAGQYTRLHSFGETATSASLPYTGLVQAPDGNLYGTTLLGGTNNKGAIYRISLSGSNFEVVHQFSGTDGENPQGQLMVGGDGALYGTTVVGGAAGKGAIYKITTAGSFTLLYSFPSLSAFNSAGNAFNATGAYPKAGLLLAADGNYYGTAWKGGTEGYGTLFRMTPAGDVAVLHAFAGAIAGGALPQSTVVQDVAGNFYGTTLAGGHQDKGTAWRVSSSGQFSLLHGFVDLGVDGSSPFAGLLLANGSIYGASIADTAANKGTLFKLDLGSNGVLPVAFAISPEEIVRGSNATITWSSLTAASCTAGGAWTNGTVATSGTQTVAPLLAGIYIYGLSCTDGAGVVRQAYSALAATGPNLEPEDGGASGTGILSVPLLLLLAALLFRKTLREIFTTCP